MKLIFLIVAITIFTSLRGDFFSDPKLCSAEELAQELKQKTLDMSWHFGRDSHFRFESQNDDVYFEIQLGTLSDNDFVARVGHKFVKNEKGLIFSYKMKSDELNRPQPSSRNGHPDENSYIVSDRRVIENGAPHRISQNELETIIRDKKVLFYTGAGLSLASNVPAMKELYELLQLEGGENFLFSLEKALENPREFASKIEVFHQACFFSLPTKAHYALKDLAISKKSRIITENLDALHEASGIYPYRIDPDHLRSGISLEPFDYIICIGLSYDDRGFLGWYKQQNPQGKIVAIDLNQPSYLGDEDFLVIGDIQEVIPAIQKAIIQ